MKSLTFLHSRIGMRGPRCCVAAALGLSLAACVAPPPPRPVVVVPPPQPKLFVYPAQGQSPQQTDRDRYECHVWAVQTTGVDPSREPQVYTYVQSPPPPGANAVSGAVGGAFAGSILAGPYNSGSGFLIGAAAGALIGSAVDAQAQAQARQSQEQVNQAAAAASARADSYRQALATCLRGRGYSVT